VRHYKSKIQSFTHFSHSIDTCIIHNHSLHDKTNTIIVAKIVCFYSTASAFQTSLHSRSVRVSPGLPNSHLKGADYGTVELNFTNTFRIVGYLKYKHTHAHIC